MKIIKYIFLVILTIFLIGFISFYFIQKNISSNLERQNKSVNALWEKFNSQLAERDDFLTSLNVAESDSLNLLIRKSKLDRENKENSLEIEFNEFQLNKYVMNKYSNENLSNLNLLLNKSRTKYNSAVQEYNFYYSIFPNFIVARQNKLKRAEYFTIKYGIENEDPIKKSKELPEWAKNVDTL